MTVNRAEANEVALRRLTEADPVLLEVRKAADVLPGMKPNMVLTSGAPLAWEDYAGRQRQAVLYGAVHEGLAGSAEEAAKKIEAGEILVESTFDHDCVGLHAGIYTASMSVFVVEDRASKKRGYCNFFEGDLPRRLGFGCYDEEIAERMLFVERVVAPTIAEALRRSGPLSLQPLICRALHLGDDLHARPIASTFLFTRALTPAFLDIAREREEEVRQTLEFLETAAYTFLRIWLAAAKAISDAANEVEGSSLITAMGFNSSGFGMRVSGLGARWFRGPYPHFEGRLGGGKWVSPDNPLLEKAFSQGTDCPLGECLGLGAFASAAAFMLQGYQGVAPEKMVERTLSMYDITVGEHPEYRIPYLGLRGVPVGIDIFKVLETGTMPLFQGLIAGEEGTVIGTGIAWPPREAIEAAASAWEERYGRP